MAPASRSKSHGPVHPQVLGADPLADLRIPDPAPAVGVLLAAVHADETEAELVGLPAVFDQAWHESAITAVTARWHADRTAERALHKGTVCNCRYLARLALLEAVGVALDPIVEGEQVAPDA